MKSTVVLTALLGDQPDRLEIGPPDVPPGCDCVCITDRPAEPLPDGWVRAEFPNFGPVAESRLKARWVRAQALRIYAGADVLIWIDASFDLLVSPRVILKDFERRDVDLLGFRHPDRSRIRDEAAAIVALGQIRETEADRILEEYRAEGFDSDEEPQETLTAGGFLVRRRSPAAVRFGDFWWAEILKFGARADQLSLDRCARLAGVSVDYLNGHYAKHPWVRYDRARHRGLKPA